jgi:hypothetical protein
MLLRRLLLQIEPPTLLHLHLVQRQMHKLKLAQPQIHNLYSI